MKMHNFNNGAGALEDSLEVSHTAKHPLTIRSSSMLLGTDPGEMKTRS